jgi:hypothetical protein
METPDYLDGIKLITNKLPNHEVACKSPEEIIAICSGVIDTGEFNVFISYQIQEMVSMGLIASRSVNTTQINCLYPLHVNGQSDKLGKLVKCIHCLINCGSFYLFWKLRYLQQATISFSKLRYTQY